MSEFITMQGFVHQVDTGNMKLEPWLVENRHWIEQQLRLKGAILLRGLRVHGSRQVAKCFSTLFDDALLPYVHRSTPRTELNGNIYTATEYHSDQLIVQHNEQAYTNDWPMRIGFFCMLPSAQGGETPIADSRKVFDAIPAAIREEFTAKRLRYVRHYSDIDLPWKEVFGTDSRQEVEAFCRANHIAFEWLADNALRTQQTLPAVQQHPVTGEWLWFNQAHLFHSSALEPAIRNELLQSRGEANLPRHVYFGDGSAIDDAYLQCIRDIYQQLKIKFTWQKGDVMLLDNMLFSHGREPFSGERKVLVGMAKPYSQIDRNLERV